MAVLSSKTIVGTIGRVYDLRTIGQDKKSVIDFSVAVTPRKRVDGEWTDGETLWNSVTAWERLADHVSESVKSGDRVIVIGREEMKPGYTNREGVEVPGKPIMVADFVGLELSYHSAESKRESNGKGGGNSASRPAARPAADKPAAAAPAATEAASPAAKSDDIFGGDDDFSFDSTETEFPF